MGVFSDLDSAIVVNFGHCVWSLVLGLSVLAVFFENDADFVADDIVMGEASSILVCVVLNDSCVFALPDTVPIGFESNRQEGITPDG